MEHDQYDTKGRKVKDRNTKSLTVTPNQPHFSYEVLGLYGSLPIIGGPFRGAWSAAQLFQVSAHLLEVLFLTEIIAVKFFNFICLKRVYSKVVVNH